MTRILLTLAVAAAAIPSARAAGSVVGSRHDLSVTGPGPIRAESEGNPCVFCHISHSGGERALSSRPDPAAVHRPYESSTISSRVGAPTGASRVCLSCHDGTIAVGKLRNNRSIKMRVDRIPGERRSNLGTDLRKTHPVSFPPAPGSRTRAPGAGRPVQLDRAGQVQCTSCHDPHEEYRDPTVGKFLVMRSQRSALCLECHEKTAVEGTGASHAISAATFGPAEGNEAGHASVAEAGCAACHASHTTSVVPRLVKNVPGDDDGACLRCHASAVTRLHLGRDVQKPYAHAGRGRGVHDASEGRPGAAVSLPERSPGTPRHAACVDCHDPHFASAQRAASAPAAGGALAGVWGIDLNGQRVQPVHFEYEVCFKCHADSANKPQANGPRPPATIRRAIPDADLRQVFSPSAASFHPVAAPGRNPDVPSLKPPLTAASMIYCSDCHASDGGGARGPHGSSYPGLLERNYSTADFTPESESAYALCYKCHDREKLHDPRLDAFRKVVSPTETRSLHAVHVRERSAPCAACHDSHGVSLQAGTPAENAHLVHFDVGIVRPGALGQLRYRTSGPRAGSCTLTCHGVEHTAQQHQY